MLWMELGSAPSGPTAANEPPPVPRPLRAVELPEDTAGRGRTRKPRREDDFEAQLRNIRKPTGSSGAKKVGIVTAIVVAIAVVWFIGSVINSDNRRNRRNVFQPQFVPQPGIDRDQVRIAEAIRLNRDAKFAEALQELDALDNLEGPSAASARERGEALRGLNRADEALAAYRKSLDMNPRDAEAFFGYLCAIAPGRLETDVGARFSRIDQPAAHFERFAADCKQANDFHSMKQLAAEMVRIDPRSSLADFYRSLAEARLDSPAAAIASFRSALVKEADARQRIHFGEEFLKAMASCGRAIDAYAVIPDARAAFRVAAADLQRTHQLDPLGRLVRLHSRKHPDDPNLPLYRAELLADDGRYAEAEKAFAAEVAKVPDEMLLQDFQYTRVHVAYRLGKATDALERIPPRDATWQSLVSLCYQDRDFVLLEKLIEQQLAKQPNDVEARRQRMIVRIHQGKTDEAAAILHALIAREADENRRKGFISGFLYTMANEGRVLDAYAAAPNKREGFDLLARDLPRNGRWDQLGKLIQLHAAVDPDDGMLAFYRGQIHLHDKDWAKAAEALAEASRIAEQDRERIRPQLLFARYKTGQGVAAFHDINPSPQTFQQLAILMVQDKKWDELEAILKAGRVWIPFDPVLPQYEARLLILRDHKPAEAAKLLVEAAKRAPAPKQGEFVLNPWFQFFMDTQTIDKPLEGYRLAPDKVIAFENVARYLVEKKNADLLEILLREHLKQVPDGAVSRTYRAELHLLRSQNVLALTEARRALELAVGQQRYAGQLVLYRAAIQSGVAALVLREQAGDTNTYRALVTQCLLAKRTDQLGAVLRMQRSIDPDDGELEVDELDLLWLKKDYAEIVRRLNAATDGPLRALRFSYRVEAHRIRSLVRLKRFPEAVAVAEAALKKGSYSSVLLLLPYAAQGDVKRTLEFADKYCRASYVLRECYRDEDLGPLLRSPAFASFRERFPEPSADFRDDFDDDD